MAKKKLLDFIDEAVADVTVVEEPRVAGSKVLADHFASLPFLAYKITFVYLEDFSLSTDQRKEETMFAKSMDIVDAAVHRALNQGISVLRDDTILHIPAHRVLQALVTRNTDGQ